MTVSLMLRSKETVSYAHFWESGVTESLTEEERSLRPRSDMLIDVWWLEVWFS